MRVFSGVVAQIINTIPKNEYIALRDKLNVLFEEYKYKAPELVDKLASSSIHSRT